MGRKIALLLAVVLSLSLAACETGDRAESTETEVSAGSQTEAPETEESDISASEESWSAGSNVLIAYFSVPEDVDTTDAVAGASIVVRDGEKLGNTEYVAKLLQETVGGDMPMAVYSFLEGYDFGAKTIIPFITHGGSRASYTVSTISQLQPGALMMGNELVLSRNDVAESEETIMGWAQGLGINAEADLPEAGDSSTVLTAAADAHNSQTHTGRRCSGSGPRGPLCPQKRGCLVNGSALDGGYAPDALDEVSADAAADGMIYSFYGRLSVGSTDVEMLRAGNLPPTFYCYGTRDPFYQQFLANADAVEAAGVRVERLQLDGRPHGFGYREGWFDAYDKFLNDVFSGQ